MASIFAVNSIDAKRQPFMKNLAFGSFVGSLSCSLVPLIQMAGSALAYNAVVATGVMCSSLALIAYYSPDERFLRMGGMLSLGLGGLIGINIYNYFRPTPFLFNLSLYGGLMLFGAFLLHDVQKVIYNAKYHERFDPVNESLKIYLDFIIIFQKLLIIMMANKKK